MYLTKIKEISFPFDRAALLTLALATLGCPDGKETETGAASETASDESSESDDGSDATTMSMTTDPTASPESTTSGPSTADESTSVGDTAGETGIDAPVCDIWAQDCQGTDQKCNPVDTDFDGFPDSTRCVQLSPNPKEVGEPCTQADGGLIDDCRKGSECMIATVTTPEPVEGICVALCEGTPSAPTCSGGDTTCVVWNAGNEPWCIQSCDILAQDCPHESWMCFFATVEAGGGCVVDDPGPGGALNDPCGGCGTCCNRGLFCAGAGALAGCETDSCCTEYCDVNAPVCSGEAQGEVCVPASQFLPPAPGTEDVGVCILQQ